MKLPKTIYVRVDTPNNDDPYFVATEKIEIDGDGPAEVGVYKLVEKRTVRKVLEQAPKRGKMEGGE